MRGIRNRNYVTNKKEKQTTHRRRRGRGRRTKQPKTKTKCRQGQKTPPIQMKENIIIIIKPINK